MNPNLKVMVDNGTEIEGEALLYFVLENTGKEYLMYTFDEKDSQHMETIHVSSLVRNGDSYKLESMSMEEWEQAKNLMRKIIRNEEG